jgi:hypothetical protein
MIFSINDVTAYLNALMDTARGKFLFIEGRKGRGVLGVAISMHVDTESISRRTEEKYIKENLGADVLSRTDYDLTVFSFSLIKQHFNLSVGFLDLPISGPV